MQSSKQDGEVSVEYGLELDGMIVAIVVLVQWCAVLVITMFHEAPTFRGGCMFDG